MARDYVRHDENRESMFREISDLMGKMAEVMDTISEGCFTKEEDGQRITVKRDENGFSIKWEAGEEEEFDDSSALEILATLKESLDKLDDDLFLEVVEKMKEKKIDINKLDGYLDAESLDEDGAAEAVAMVDMTNEIAREVINKKVEGLLELREEF